AECHELCAASATPRGCRRGQLTTPTTLTPPRTSRRRNVNQGLGLSCRLRAPRGLLAPGRVASAECIGACALSAVDAPRRHRRWLEHLDVGAPTAIECQ